MSNISQEEESQESIHQQPLHGHCPQKASVGGSISPAATKRRRSLPGNPDPDAEVIALSPRSLLATNRYICEVCHKGFQRDQNLQLHRRGHNLPWKLKQRAGSEVKKRVYVCPEPSCVHHDPSRALGDLTGIKKHFSRKHGEKKWKCDKCSKRYAVQSDWKAHSKICGTKEYRCDCGTIFSRKDSFVTHRAFCDALVEPNYRATHGLDAVAEEPVPCAGAHTMTRSSSVPNLGMNNPLRSVSLSTFAASTSESGFGTNSSRVSPLGLGGIAMASFGCGNQPHGLHAAPGSAYMSATALLQKAAEMGAKVSDDSTSPILFRGFTGYHLNGAAPFVEAAADSSHTAADGSGMGDVGTDTMNPESTLQQDGMVNNLLVLHSDYKIPAKAFSSQHGMQGTVQEELCGIQARATQDFLGLGAVGGVSTDGQSCHEGSEGLGFTIGQQNEASMHSYHHHPTPEHNHEAALDRPMWNYSYR